MACGDHCVFGSVSDRFTALLWVVKRHRMFFFMTVIRILSHRFLPFTCASSPTDLSSAVEYPCLVSCPGVESVERRYSSDGGFRGFDHRKLQCYCFSCVRILCQPTLEIELDRFGCSLFLIDPRRIFMTVLGRHDHENGIPPGSYVKNRRSNSLGSQTSESVSLCSTPFFAPSFSSNDG